MAHLQNTFANGETENSEKLSPIQVNDGLVIDSERIAKRTHFT
jgi:hypothetical protein